MSSFEYTLPVEGETRAYECRVIPFAQDQVLCVIRNVTERKNAEEQLRTSLHEKEILLKEIHHRVKNNMQVVSSLLNMQAYEIQDETMRGLFRESQSRVRSMALVHDRLYRSENMAGIDFAEYLQSMVAELVRGSFREGISCTIEADPVRIGIDNAIPCALIVHELVTNSLKHAFQGRSNGAVRIMLRQSVPTEVTIVVQDDGVGFPPDKSFRKCTSMGMTLVTSLTEQLRGTIDLSSGDGCRFAVTFPA
jgi:two-component sensor histidine kinase